MQSFRIRMRRIDSCGSPTISSEISHLVDILSSSLIYASYILSHIELFHLFIQISWEKLHQSYLLNQSF